MKKLLVLVLFLTSTVFAFDFNTASKKALTQLKGIGAKKAEAIIQYRKKHKIKSIDDLKNIKGFNSKLIDKLKKQLQKKNRFKKQLKNKKKNMNKKMSSKKDSLKSKGKMF